MPERQESQESMSTCLVCGLDSPEVNCPRCGVDREALQRQGLAEREPFPEESAKWSELRAHVRRTAGRSMAVWDMLSPEFKAETLSRYRELRLRSVRFCGAVMVPVLFVALMTGFAAGVAVCRHLLGWPAGANGQWAFALLFMPLVALPVGIAVEGLLGRARPIRAEREFLLSRGLVGLALIGLTPLPWYHHPGLWFVLLLLLAGAAGRAALPILP